MKVMISQPMRGRSDEEILAEKMEIETFLKKDGYEVINSYFSDFNEADYHNVPLAYLAKSLEIMAQCDAVFFAEGWEEARGCQLEHHAAMDYGLYIIHRKV